MFFYNKTSPVTVKNRRSWQTVVFACAALVLSCAAADVSAEWRGSVEGGAQLGSNSSSTRLRLVLRNDQRPLTHYVYAEWLQSGANNDSYAIGYNPRYWFAAMQSDTTLVIGLIKSTMHLVKPEYVIRQVLE